MGTVSVAASWFLALATAVPLGLLLGRAGFWGEGRAWAAAEFVVMGASFTVLYGAAALLLFRSTLRDVAGVLPGRIGNRLPRALRANVGRGGDDSEGS